VRLAREYTSRQVGANRPPPTGRSLRDLSVGLKPDRESALQPLHLESRDGRVVPGQHHPIRRQAVVQ